MHKAMDRFSPFVRGRAKRSVGALVIGLGSMAYGKERRGILTLKHMENVNPHFLTSKWEDGSVTRLLQQNEFGFTRTSFGYLGRARPTWTLINVLHMPHLFWTVIRKYVQEHCALILILNIQSFVNASPAILLLKYFTNARLVFYLGDIPKDYGVNRFVGRLIARMADKVIANSHAVEQGLIAIGIPKTKIRVIYNGIDIDKFGRAIPCDFRGMHGWNSDAVLIGYAGQFSPNKGAIDLVKAAEIVLSRNQNCRFVLIGGAGANDEQRAVADYAKIHHLNGEVVFTGWTDEIERAYAGLDIMVVPSRHEDPAPNVNLEAMASGIPVIATRVGGIPELVLDGVTGLLVNKESPEQIADCILRLAGDPRERESIGRAGMLRVREMFDIRKNARIVEEAILSG